MADGRVDSTALGWWQQAIALEQADRLAEAEQTITAALPHSGAAATVAELYAQRMERLQQAGEERAARQAFEEAERWIQFYASQATSGGEGAALALERERFRAALVRRLGYDPGH